jgi:5-dehydro-4-deoxyglucarate dehydratase
MVQSMLDEFYAPIVALRDRKRGYSVSIVKAGLKVVGASAGPVRPPLVDFDAEEEALLSALIAKTSQWNR